MADSKRKPYARDRGDCARQSVEKAKHSRVSEEAEENTETRLPVFAKCQWLCLNMHLHFQNCSALHKYENVFPAFVQVCEEFLKVRNWG